ncbi:related to glucosidase I [Melanopsichium pennsylvanicum]|uniref:Related to glucosidase I n=2 Tax=Melanopsichium pennsylvanicum TaxID=63383 RepID=A0AAJ5C6G2_9BASI|nr:glycoside hydrolase family 63 protein [Melanopsichium pennsylvanicum 4]SNX85801.1 related to glucosidase I [Melanopsichium pennsylvanicum]
MASRLRQVFGSSRTKSSASGSSHGRLRSEDDQSSSNSIPSSPAASLSKASSRMFGRSERGASPSPAPSSPHPPATPSNNTITTSPTPDNASTPPPAAASSAPSSSPRIANPTTTSQTQQLPPPIPTKNDSKSTPTPSQVQSSTATPTAESAPVAANAAHRPSASAAPTAASNASDLAQSGGITPTTGNPDSNKPAIESAAAPAAPAPTSNMTEPSKPLSINIPANNQQEASQPSATELPKKQPKTDAKVTNGSSADTSVADKDDLTPVGISNKSSFHSRTTADQFRADYHPDNASKYTNPNHYSARPETYHRKSFSAASQGAPSQGEATPAGSRRQSGSEHDLGHGRGPTGNLNHAVDARSHGHPWISVEDQRLQEDIDKKRHWKRWGPYLSERQWGTVREDYSANGDAWSHFPHESARSRTYRWGEDGLAGLSDNHCRMGLSLALWNGKDRMLKERLFGLANNEGNHGEDVKELYWYLDSTPTHSYMKMLYKYPQESYPYELFVRESRNRSRDVAEFEVTDTDLFDEDKYWDVFIEYAKDKDEENAISIRISAYNRGAEPADLHIIPQLVFRNYWFWPKEEPPKPKMKQTGDYVIQTDHPELGRYHLYCSTSPAPSAPPAKRGQAPEPISDEEVVPELLFTENETNFERLYNGSNKNIYAKDAFHDHIVPAHRQEKDRPKAVEKTRNIKKTIVRQERRPVHRDPEAIAPKADGASADAQPEAAAAEKQFGTVGPVEDQEYEVVDIEEEIVEEEKYLEDPDETKPPRDYVNPNKEGTKAGAHYVFRQVPPFGGCAVVRMKLTPKTPSQDAAIDDDEQFDTTVESRRSEADEFYAKLISGPMSDDMKNVMRQALAGMLWNKQFYMFVQPEWLRGDPGQPAPPPERKHIRNHDWRHLHMEDILSMPDKWEYPFSAVWDSAFHCIPLAMVDPAFAKKQLDLFTREWYMKPDGALPAYEWNFSDVNPPVHAWATFRVFKIERKMYGREDLDFLERVFQKLLINFTWWVNRKDSSGSNVFEGGFLGLDNIGPFNRSEPLPTGGTLRQADGTAWMAFYALNMLNMALELAKHNPTYEDIASKFFEHFIFISDAMSFHDTFDDESTSLWSDKDGFYYDAIQWGPGNSQVIPVKSLVGLIPLYATLTIEPSALKRFPSFAKRMQWFLDNRPEMADRNIANMKVGGRGDRRLLSMVSRERLELILKRMLDENEFLSPHGVRSLSKDHQKNPFHVNVGGEDFGVGYWPGDSHSPMFGGNSNWRGPIWICVNFLLIESLQRFYQYYGDSFKVECPTGSGDYMHLGHVAEELSHRLLGIFLRDDQGRRANNGGIPMLDYAPEFRDLVHFYEFFHGDTGKGLGASHQCGWTGLIAYTIYSTGASYGLAQTPRTPKSTAAHYFDEHLTEDGRSEAGSVPYSNAYSRPPSPDEL